MMDEKLRQEIRRRAYEIWEQEGRPTGLHMDHWLRAEREVSAGFPTAAAVGKRTKAPAGKKSASTRKADVQGAATKAANQAARMPKGRAPRKD